MEHKDYKLEIISELLKDESHIRAIAKKIGTNHMMILRKISELVKENVLDYKKEGKNNRYFIKRTTEARNYIFAVEGYKLNQTLKKYPSLRGIIERIQKDKRIKLAILFGSYAKGIAKEESDIDIFIDNTNPKIKNELRLFDGKLSIKNGEYDKSSILIKEIEKNNIIIKGVEEYYEKNKFFD